MRSVLVLETAGSHPASRQELSRRAAEAAVKAAGIVGSHQEDAFFKKPRSVKKLSSGQPVLKPMPRHHRTHISISHISDTVAGFAASEEL